MDHNTLLDMVKTIKPLNAVRYLRSKQWRMVSNVPRDNIYLFNHSKYQYRQIIVPKDSDYELYSYDILEAVIKLQEVEHRDIESIIAQIRNPDVDVLRYRIQSPQAASGSLSLGVIGKFISGVVASLKAAVCDQITPSVHHTRVGLKQIKKLLERAQFGQTEHGSYVVKVLVPVDIVDEKNEFTEIQATTVRDGVIHLLKSVDKIVKSVHRGTLNLLAKKAAETPMFSDNLVNAIVDMQLWEDASIEISTEWSPIFKPANKTLSRVTIPAEYFKDIDRFSHLLAPKVAERPIEFFTGFVSELYGETNDAGNKYGLVGVKVATSDEENFEAFVNLKEDEHSLAIKSYEHNLPVTFSGKLIRRSDRCREIINIGFFYLCQREEAATE